MVKTSGKTIRPIDGGCLKRRLLFKRVRPTESVPPQHDDVCPKGTWGRGGGYYYSDIDCRIFRLQEN